MVSCELCDIGMRLKKWNCGVGTRCEEGVCIKDQSQCGIWSCKDWLGVHLADRLYSGA